MFFNALRTTLVCTLALLCCATWAGDGRYRIVHAFEYNAETGTEGSRPSGGLMQASDGFLYGQTSGTYIYRLSLAGEFTALRSSNPEHGLSSGGSLVEGQDGRLYGTWGYAGIYSYRGLVFSFTPSGQWALVHTFNWRHGKTGDGAYPLSRLLLAGDGWLYGTTSGGGDYAHHSGTIYRVNSADKLQISHVFPRPHQQADAAFMPVAPLTTDGQSGFFGTAYDGGTHGDGAIFQVDAASAVQVLYNFRASRDGSRPMTEPLRGRNDSFWGTTSHGGAWGCGTLYELRAGGHLRVLHHFDPGISNPCPDVVRPDWRTPTPSLMVDNKGVFYGTSPFGGQHGWGQLFRLSPNGEFTVLHDFGEQGVDGRQPNSAPVLASDGFLYGTTSTGGADGTGTIYRIRP